MFLSCDNVRIEDIGRIMEVQKCTDSCLSEDVKFELLGDWTLEMYSKRTGRSPSASFIATAVDKKTFALMQRNKEEEGLW